MIGVLKAVREASGWQTRSSPVANPVSTGDQPVRGRGVSVHRTDCANALSLRTQSERVIDVEWDNDAPGNYVVSVEIEALDRSRLLRDVADVLSEHHVNIIACSSQTQADRIARLRFEFELADPGHLHSILLAVKRVGSVYEATRVLPGART